MHLTDGRKRGGQGFACFEKMGLIYRLKITDGLRFPESPVCVSDGSIILVEVERGTLTRVSPSGEETVIAELWRT